MTMMDHFLANGYKAIGYAYVTIPFHSLCDNVVEYEPPHKAPHHGPYATTSDLCFFSVSQSFN